MPASNTGAYPGQPNASFSMYCMSGSVNTFLWKRQFTAGEKIEILL